MFVLALTACLQTPPVDDSGAPDDTGVDNTDSADSTDTSDSADSEDSPVDTSPLPMPSPEAAGPFAVSARTVSVPTDLGAVTVHLSVPAGAGPWPWVLLLPGFQLTPEEYALTATRAASHGYLVASPALPFGSGFSFNTHTQLADASEAVVEALRAGAEPLRDDELVLAGHSLGGKLAMLLASRGVTHVGVFAIDPVDTGDPSVVPQQMSALSQPLALLGETTNGSGGLFGQNCAPLAENFQQAYSAAAVPVVELELVGANHMSFLDDPNCGLVCLACTSGTDSPSTTVAITRRSLVAFLYHVVDEHPDARDWLVGTGVQGDVTGGRVVVRSKNGF